MLRPEACLSLTDKRKKKSQRANKDFIYGQARRSPTTTQQLSTQLDLISRLLKSDMMVVGSQNNAVVWTDSIRKLICRLTSLRRVALSTHYTAVLR